jgi:hypothetical protein
MYKKNYTNFHEQCTSWTELYSLRKCDEIILHSTTVPQTTPSVWLLSNCGKKTEFHCIMLHTQRWRNYSQIKCHINDNNDTCRVSIFIMWLYVRYNFRETKYGSQRVSEMAHVSSTLNYFSPIPVKVNDTSRYQHSLSTFLRNFTSLQGLGCSYLLNLHKMLHVCLLCAESKVAVPHT